MTATTTTTSATTDLSPTGASAGRGGSGPPLGRKALWLLAGVVVAQPVLLAANALFHPEVDLTGEGLLAGAEEGPTTWYLVHLVAATGALLGAPAAVALRRLAPGPGRLAATAGMWFNVLAAVVLSMTFAVEASVLRLAAADLDPAAGRALAEAYAATPEFYAVGIGVASATLGGILLAVGILLGRAVPRWQAGVYVVGAVAVAVGPPGTPVGPAGFGLMAVASVPLAARLVAIGPPARHAVRAASPRARR